MSKRAVLIAGLSVALALLSGSPILADDKAGKDSSCCTESGNTCSLCRDICLKALNYCISKGGKYVAPNHLNTLLDCVDTCDLNSRFAARSSQTHASMSKVCSEVCGRCAKSCEELADPQLAECVKSCQTCSKFCAAGEHK